MAVMNEHDLYRTWIPLLKVSAQALSKRVRDVAKAPSKQEVRRVKQISRYRKVMYLSAHLPWPISSRDAVYDLFPRL